MKQTLQNNENTSVKQTDDINNNTSVKQIPTCKSTDSIAAENPTQDTHVKSVNSTFSVPKDENSQSKSISPQHSADVILLQNAFTDALSAMNRSQCSLLQQLESSFAKSIENSLNPVVDQLKKQLHAVQQLNDNLSKKDNRKYEENSEVEKLQNKISTLLEENTKLRTEKYDTAVQIAKFESQLESEKVRNDTCKEKLQISIKSITEENEVLRHKVNEQKSDYEQFMSEYKQLKEKYDTQFDEFFSLKTQLSNSFNTNKGDSAVKGSALSQEPGRTTAVLLGTSNISGIKPDKLSKSVDVSKSTTFTLDDAFSKIGNLETKPNVILLHALTNDIKEHTPEQCVEKLGNLVQLINSKWENTKTIISLTTPRSDSEIHCVNSEILDALIKKRFLSQKNVYL